MKKIKFDTNNAQFPLNQMFAISLILIGFAYGFYFSNSIHFSPVIDGDAHGKLPPELPPMVDNSTVSVQSPVNSTRFLEGSIECDTFTGEWVRDPSGPRYTNLSCNNIEQHENCMKNGRPDFDYIYWRWSPAHCDLPKFDPRMFLHFMNNKSIAFVGDPISRNHLESLLCILSQVEEAVEVYHDDEYRSKRWYFESHNFTLSLIWSPFLTKANIFEDKGAIELHLDELDIVWVNEFDNFDYINIAGGYWFLKPAVYYENNTVIGCHNCNKENNISEVGFAYTYRKALRKALTFVTRSKQEVYALFRTTTSDHYENGEWNTGGSCHRTVPFKEGEIDMKDINKIMRDIELEEFVNAKVGLNNGSVLRMLDASGLMLLRPDGHPGPYRVFHPFEGKDKDAKVQNDCLHWCLPGPIDSWNDLMINLLIKFIRDVKRKEEFMSTYRMNFLCYFLSKTIFTNLIIYKSHTSI